MRVELFNSAPSVRTLENVHTVMWGLLRRRLHAVMTSAPETPVLPVPHGGLLHWAPSRTLAKRVQRLGEMFPQISLSRALYLCCLVAPSFFIVCLYLVAVSLPPSLSISRSPPCLSNLSSDAFSFFTLSFLLFRLVLPLTLSDYPCITSPSISLLLYHSLHVSLYHSL